MPSNIGVGLKSLIPLLKRMTLGAQLTPRPNPVHQDSGQQDHQPPEKRRGG